MRSIDRLTAASLTVIAGAGVGAAQVFPPVFNLGSLPTGDGTNGVAFTGGVPYGGAGFTVAGGGDLNGDGIPDIVIGAPEADFGEPTPNGEVYVVFGRAGLPANTALTGFTGADGFVITNTVAEGLGRAADIVGDVNGDGLDDLLLGLPGDLLANPRGAGYVLFGRDTTMGASFPASIDIGALPAGAGFRINGSIDDSETGTDVSAAGDVNGDNIADFILGNFDISTTGTSYVVFGRDTVGGPDFPASFSVDDLDGTNGFAIDGVALSDSAGRGVGGGGDINGDGIDDLIVGAYYASPVSRAYAGQSYVVFGRNTTTGPGFPARVALGTLGAGDGFTINGAGAYDGIGFSVDAAGDVNGDGIGDLILSTYQYGGYAANPGTVAYLVFGRDVSVDGPFPTTIDLGTLTPAQGVPVTLSSANGYAISFVSAAGDINGDGLDDVVIGLPVFGLSSLPFPSSAAFIVFGQSSFSGSIDLGQLDGDNGVRLGQASLLDLTGGSVSGAGDISGDGIDDVLVGAPSSGAFAGPMPYTGQVYLVYGRQVDLTPPFCSPADLALPAGTLDAFDRAAFFAEGAAGGPVADLFPLDTPDSMFTASDIIAFDTIFTLGCD
ncbi:MAG: integrin alpha [Planctomycetota bacterium]